MRLVYVNDKGSDDVAAACIVLVMFSGICVRLVG